MMPQIREPNWEALTRFLLSEQTDKQDKEVRAWLAESPDHSALLDALRSALKADGRSAIDDRAWMWAAIEAGISQTHASAVHAFGDSSRAQRYMLRRGTHGNAAVWRRAAWLAAACIAIAGTAALVVVRRHPALSVATQPVAAMQEVITQPGKTAVVRLSDGSSVVLGVGSRLRYAATFARSERDVYLDGEAFFTVTHASGWPFVVHAGGVSARVLGTRFSVRKYAADSAARVIVAQGQVTVRSELLKAGDAITAWPDGNSTVTHHVDVGQAMAWTASDLEFRETPLSIVIPNLERAFNITIRVNDSTLYAEPITASLARENSRDAMQIIATITHSRTVWGNKRVTLIRP